MQVPGTGVPFLSSASTHDPANEAGTSGTLKQFTLMYPSTLPVTGLLHPGPDTRDAKANASVLLCPSGSLSIRTVKGEPVLTTMTPPNSQPPRTYSVTVPP